MSAIPATGPSTTTTERRQHRSRSEPERRPARRVMTRRQARDRSATWAKVTGFVIIAGLTFMASSLAGQVMVEKARREGLRASERAREARKVEAVLRQKIDYLGSLGTVEAWATSHNFVAPDGVIQPAQQVTRVASAH